MKIKLIRELLVFLIIGSLLVSSATVDVNIQGSEFQSIDPITVGDQVRWTNNDNSPHTVTSDTGGLFNGQLPGGQQSTFTHTFQSAGVFNYHCTFHI